MNDRLIMLEGYEPPVTSIKEDGIYDYENLGWSPKSLVRRVTSSVSSVANAAQAVANQVAHNKLLATMQAATQNARNQMQATLRAIQLQQANAIALTKSQTLNAARSKAQSYINESKAQIVSQTTKAKSVFPVATIQRARADVAKKMSNPKVQMGIAISAAVAANIPLVGEKLANGIMLTNAVALGKSPQEILETTPGLMEYTQSPQYQQLMALANNPTMANFQSMLGQMDAETATMARAMMEEMQQYAGGVTEKVIENAFSIFDLLTEGKLF